MTKMEALFNAILYLRNGGNGTFRLGEAEASATQVQAFVAKNIQSYMIAGYNRLPGDSKKAIQAFTGTSDVEKITANVWNAFQEAPNYDLLWQRAFRSVPLRKGQLYWEIGTVKSGVTFKLLKEGEKVEYAKISGDKVTGKVDLFGGGLQIDWNVLEGRDLAAFYNATTDFKANKMSQIADIFYELLATASAEHTVAYQGETTDTQIDRDIATLNKAYETVSQACKDLGFGDTANANMLIYFSPLLKARIQAALKASAEMIVAAGGNGNTVVHTIEPLISWNGNIPEGKGMMVLPGNKIQNSLYMEEKTFERTNPDNLAFLKSSFMAFGGVIGETKQTALVSFS